MKILIRLALAAALVSLPAAADSPQFRGPQRDGTFAESGLPRSWPEGGPPLLWSADGLGESYASVSVVDGEVYTTGKHGERGSAFAFDRDGKLKWKTEYGTEHSGRGYPGTRTTPTFDGGALFLLSSTGEAVSLDAASGEIRWRVDILERFDGENIRFGIAESPLVDGGRVIYTPGGKKATIVALDRDSGETVWASPALGDLSAYCNPRILEHDGGRQIVTLVQKHLVGVDPESGAILWREPVTAQYDIHANSPVFDGRRIYVSHGYGRGGMLFELAADGRSVEKRWTEDELDVHHGGAVAVDGRIYGAASNGTWYALDAASGEILASIRRLGKGSVIYADGMLYGYLEKGEVVLVDPDPGSFAVKSSFEITRGEGNHWSHPVVSGGVLYVRHGSALMAFGLKAAAAAAAETPLPAPSTR